jgi:azurin
MKKFILSLCLCIAPALCINVQAAEVTKPKTKQVCVKKKCKQTKMHKKHVSKKVTK